MIIIADSSPLISLAIIDKLNLLEEYFEDIFVPNAVYEEVTSINKPFAGKLKLFLTDKVLFVQNKYIVLALNEKIDIGESEAIALALEKKADFILIDDLKARKTALRNGLNVIGTLGLLLDSKKSGKIENLKEVILKLISNDIRLSEQLIQNILTEANELNL